MSASIMMGLTEYLGTDSVSWVPLTVNECVIKAVVTV